MKFILKDFDLRAKLFYLIPGIEEIKEKKILVKVDDIPVTYEDIWHEGYVAIHFQEYPQPEIVKLVGELLEEGRDEWNRKGTNGFFHNIYFTNMMEDNVALFYYDNGSAENGQFVFILNKLAGKDFGIEKIEINTL